tara:strand:+ start:251 stop:901 length:651 start_codon:yes stop_codon:yes gene_type:complete
MDSRIKSIDDFLDKDDLAYIDSIINFDLYDEKNFTIVDKNFINLPLFFGKILSTTKPIFEKIKIFDPKTGKLLEKNKPEKLNNCQFSHSFYSMGQGSTSKLFQDIDNIFKLKLSVYMWQRIKLNLLPRSDNIYVSGFHTDSKTLLTEEKTAIYYLNDCNGYTVFKDGSYVQSKKNRIVIFPKHLLHSGTTCSDKSYRAVINFNYIEVPNDTKKIKK